MARLNKTIPDQKPIEKQSELPQGPTAEELQLQMESQLRQQRENKIRQDQHDLVLGRIVGSFIRDIQTLAAENSVLTERLKDQGTT